MPRQPPESLIEIARTLRQDQAEERALAILALGLPYWILPIDGSYALMVRQHDAPRAIAELQHYETERQQEHAASRHQEPSPKAHPQTSLYLAGWLLILTFAIQTRHDPAWTDRGIADSRAILHGQWWRTVTALTLHADLPHLLANLAVGLIFAAALLPLLGTGWTWLATLLSGALGNLLNALAHRTDPHLSLGASTAVFGSMGLLIGWQIITALRTRILHHPLRRIGFPIASGLALLAYLGTGDPATARVDIMAHLFGMLTGTLLGLLLALTRLPQKTPPAIQLILAWLTPALLIAAWLKA